jgi:simple sugar transport system permease protein
MLYKFTTFGYKQDIVGSNASALDYVGINRKREQYKTFMISGALAGLAGAMVFIGQTNPPFNEFQADMPAAFYNGISISLLAANAPLGIIFSTFMIASFETAAAEIGTVTGGVPVAEIILAVSLIFVASFRVFDYINPFEKIKV